MKSNYCFFPACLQPDRTDHPHLLACPTHWGMVAPDIAAKFDVVFQTVARDSDWRLAGADTRAADMANPAMRAIHLLARAALQDAAGDKTAVGDALNKAEAEAAQAPSDPFAGVTKPSRGAAPANAREARTAR